MINQSILTHEYRFDNKTIQHNKHLAQPMNSLNLPVFIVSCASVYLLIIYALLKLAEMQKLGRNITNNSAEGRNRVEIP